jgi:glycine/D-amino acid oxidase-like deaminating enzyme
MQVDYLIIGQGLCGTWLSYYLIRAGASVLVIDPGPASSASAAASGIINPITGKRLARQWMAETIQPFAEEAYSMMGDALGVPLARTIPINTYFSTAEEAAFFENKANTSHEDLLSTNSQATGIDHFNYHYGVGTIFPAMLVDVKELLAAWRTELAAQDALREEVFDWSEYEAVGKLAHYKDIQAKAVIDCSGAATATNPWFSRLPFALNKGEGLIASIPGLQWGAIHKYSTLSIVPWEGDNYWIGSTFDWDFTDELPTAAFRQKADTILAQWLRLPYTIIDHFAAIRPATVTRDAFAGLHPHNPTVGILNGMGSKGCSLAPFLAHNLAGHLVRGTPLITQVDVTRYARVLSR